MPKVRIPTTTPQRGTNVAVSEMPYLHESALIRVGEAMMWTRVAP